MRVDAILLTLVGCTLLLAQQVSGQNIPLPTLDYEYTDLEPFLDEQTLKIHHLKHHAGYLKKLNVALQEMRNAGGNVKQMAKAGVDELLRHLDSVPDEWRASVRNNGGGFVNHALFWKVMSPNPNNEDRQPTGSLADKINQKFGSFANFKSQFTTAASKVFGSGWTFLAYNATDDSVRIMSTSGHDTPAMQPSQHALLVLDVWEHAYYLKYQNRRPEWIENWWHLVNWEYVSDLFLEVRAFPDSADKDEL